MTLALYRLQAQATSKIYAKSETPSAKRDLALSNSRSHVRAVDGANICACIAAFLDILRTMLGLSISEITGIDLFQFGAFEVGEHAIMFEGGHIHPNSARCY